MTWKTLRHPNVLPLIGVTMSETQFAMVSEWMDNGNLTDFVKAHPDGDRLGLVCFRSSLVVITSLITVQPPSWQVSLGDWSTFIARE